MSEIPEEVLEKIQEAKERDLTELNLRGYRLTALPESLGELQGLTQLDLSDNPIVNIPPEILGSGLLFSDGIEKIRAYFRQLEAEGQDYLYEAKLLIVGEGGAGKTTLAKKIKDPNYELREDEESTKGIEVIQWEFKMENGQPFRVNIWDFGGQEIYHATHQFFLTKRSLYAVVADSRKEDTDFNYWLNVVGLLSDNSPLLIVKNEKQDRQRAINERQLRGQFTNLKETLATNLATNRGLPEILDEIKHYICRLPHIGTALPKTWVDVRKALENEDRDYISLNEYLDICGQKGFKLKKDKLQLIEYLHDLGVCLHFQNDPLLKKTLILKPRWGTDAVYKVLDNKTVINNLGRFTRKDLAEIWHEDHYADMQDELLRLMINFKLCYQIPGARDTYIAPQLLSENQPEYDWDEADNLQLRYTYAFMPKGILTQFIVAMNKWIAEQKYVWKSGVILEKDQTKAEVIEHYGKREVQVRVAGRNRKELLTLVNYELDKIHDAYKRLKYDKLIPCNCKTCQGLSVPHFYKFESLKKRISDKRYEVECDIRYEMVNVLGLIDDVIGKGRLFDEEQRRSGGVIFQAPVEKVVFQQTEWGTNIMEEQSKGRGVVRSAWANGSFYLFAFAVVIAGLGVLANTVPFYALATILVAGLLFVPLIGALQLRQDNRLSEESFTELMKMVIGQLPLIGKVAKRDQLEE